nr:hypothetical protein [Tanacetum cinerariifolium]
MSDSDKSVITYTDISSPFEELSDIGSPRADDHEHLMLLEMLEDPYVESPEYVPESDFEAHQEDDDDEDPEEDPDDEMDIEANEEEEEEHPAPADSIVVAPTDTDQAPSVEETEPFETDEGCLTACYIFPTSITTIPLVFTTALDSFSTTTPDTITTFTMLSPAPPPSPIRSLGYRASMIRLRDEAASTSSPPLQLPSASRKEDRPEVTLLPQKRLGIALGPRYEVGESSSAAAARPAGGLRADYGFVATVDREIMRDPEREVGYGITDSWDEIVETLQGAPASTNTELGGHVREFETRVRQDTDEIYMRLDDEQTERQLLAGRLNMLFRDRRAHAYTR